MDPFDPNLAYATSKLYNILFANELGRRLAETGIVVNSVHSGVIATKIAKISDKEKNLEFFQNFSTSLNVPLISIEEGAATTVYLAISEDGAKSGGFYHGTTLAETSPLVKDEQLGKSLWELTEKLTGVTFSSFFSTDFLLWL